MHYVKKMCILRQVKQGFSGDGKTLSGLIKIEQYGKNLAVEVSIINFAPLVSGEYYCLLSDGKGKTEMLSLRGKSIFNILSDMDISGGFCAVVCYVKNEVVPIAYGINGNGSYDWRAILNKALPPVFPKKRKNGAEGEIARGESRGSEDGRRENEPRRVGEIAPFAPPAKREEISPLPTQNAPPVAATLPEKEGGKYATKDFLEGKSEPPYDDEAMATNNYYAEGENERKQSVETNENAHDQGASTGETSKKGADPSSNVDASDVLSAVNLQPDGYYLSVKRELDDLFSRYPRDTRLNGAFKHGEWVRVRGTKEAPQYLVGALYEEGKVRYICYALAAENEKEPPEEIKGVCSFVPVSPLIGAEGFFVIFQSAATGECIKPPRG